MRRLANRFEMNLRASAPAACEIKLGRFTDHNIIRLDLIHHGFERAALKNLFHHRSRYHHGAREFASVHTRCRMDHRRERAFHIHHAAPVHVRVGHFCAERGASPDGPGSDSHRIGVRIKKQSLPCLRPADHSHGRAVFIDPNLIEAESVHLVHNDLRDRAFFPRQTLLADDALREFN